MNDTMEVRELLGAHDPLTQAGAALDDLTAERIWQSLVTDVERGATPEVRPPSPTAARLARSAVAAVVVALCVLAGLAITSGGKPTHHRYAALEPLGYSRLADPAPAGPVLDRLAALAESQPRPEAGDWYYLESAAWSAFSGGDPSALPPGMPNVREQWIGPDGARRVVDHTELQPPAAGLQAWLAAGLPLNGGHTSSFTITAGESQFAAQLPTDPAGLQKRLLIDEVGAARGETYNTNAATPAVASELFTAVKDLRIDREITPALQAATLRMLAALPRVVSLGTATDRLGRVVDAIAVDSADSGLPTRHVLLFDSSSGALLGAEDILTTSAGGLDLPIPSVVSYVIYVRSGDVRDSTSLPPAL